VYEVKNGSNTAQTLVTYAEVTAGTKHKLTSHTMQESDIGVHNMKLIVSLQKVGNVDYTPLEVNFKLTITDATCNCSLLTWDMPQAQSVSTTVLKATPDFLDIVHATVNANSKTTEPAIRRCYATGQTPCDHTTTIKSVVDSGTNALPSFMKLETNKLTVSPTTNSESKTYTMKVTMTTKNNGD
jgi:hypothetical protein